MEPSQLAGSTQAVDIGFAQRAGNHEYRCWVRTDVALGVLMAELLPDQLRMMAGAYLFYAQHNFPDMIVQPRETWEYTRAALESSSYMKTGRILGWLTGDIGYHHVHHLNPGIPFYRLKDAMAGIPELQQPLGTTSLWPSDIAACFRQKLWDAEKGAMVGYPPGT